MAMQPVKVSVRWLPAFIVGLLATVLFPAPASAIPAWSRKYDVACATCHYPAPPRLNAYGHEFRRAQFRTPDEFNKDVEWKNVSNYVSARIRARYNWESNENPALTTGGVTSSFDLNDVTLFYAGPVSKHFSGFVEMERPGDDPEIELVTSIGGVRGKPESFATFRAGQFHSLVRVGFGGLDRPTGISTPMALSRALVSGNDYTVNQDQVGVEGTYVHKKMRFIGQILNGADRADASTTDHGDENRTKDWLAVYELMWGSRASGLSAFYYDGKQDDLSLPTDSIDVKRYGVTAVQDFKFGFEVQGGYVAGTDDYSIDPSPGVSNIDGDGWWLEVQQYFSKAKDLTVFGRYEELDNNNDVDDDVRTQTTLGVVWPVAEWHVRWGFEYRMISQDTGPSASYDDNQAVAELMLNF